MIQSGPQNWKWLDRDGVILYKWCDVIKIDPPVIQLFLTRGTSQVEKMKDVSVTITYIGPC